MSTTWDSSPAVIRPGTSAAIATARGSNMASSEPNAMNSTTAAASTPTAALMPAEGRSTFSTAGPMTRSAAIRDRVAGAILDVAADLLAGGGDPPSMATIAAAAGVGRATLYRYFPTREQLLHA